MKSKKIELLHTQKKILIKFKFLFGAFKYNFFTLGGALKNIFLTLGGTIKILFLSWAKF